MVYNPATVIIKAFKNTNWCSWNWLTNQVDSVISLFYVNYPDVSVCSHNAGSPAIFHEISSAILMLNDLEFVVH